MISRQLVKIDWKIICFLIFINTTSISFCKSSFDVSISNPIETGIMLDTINNSILLHLDDSQKPQFYYSEIYTPVCQSSECLPIRINLFWTLAGNYLKYTLPVGEILTKVDHIHFAEEDYHKLGLILVNKNSTLNYLRKEDFQFVNTSDTLKKVDGTTGATKKVSKRDYVEGAIFTSLTLYHLANGVAVEKMKSFTLNELIKKEEVDFFLNHSDRSTADLGFQFLKYNLNETDLLNVILKMMNSTSNQVVDLSVRYLPEFAIAIDSVEEKIAVLYCTDFTTVDTRTKLLELWSGKQLLSTTQIILAKGLLKYKENFTAVLSVLENQKEWPLELYSIFCNAILDETNLSRKEKIYKVLIIREEFFPKQIKKTVKELAKLNGWQ